MKAMFRRLSSCNRVSNRVSPDIQVKELNKCASGQSFEVILSPSSPNTKGEFLHSPLKKKETSLDEIKKKLEAAEERRKVCHVKIPSIAQRRKGHLNTLKLKNC